MKRRKKLTEAREFQEASVTGSMASERSGDRRHPRNVNYSSQNVIST